MHASKTAIKAIAAAAAAWRVVCAGCAAPGPGRAAKGRHVPVCAEKKEEITVKKSTLVAIVAFLSAVAGALGAMFLYLRRREKELDEYESLLFSEEFDQEPEEARAVSHDEEDAAPSANCIDAM